MPENHQLSERELEILRLVATGASNKDIAAELVISVNTVKVHLRNIFSKLEVSSRTEATIFAVQNGLVPSPLPPEERTIDSGESGNVSIDSGKQRLVIGTLIVVAFSLIIILGLIGFYWWRGQNQIPDVPMTAQELEKDRWQAQKGMDSPRSNFATVVLDGDILVLGGETSQGLSDLVNRYLVETNTWENVSEMPQSAADIQAVAIGGKIYIPGGRLEDGSISNQLLIYDPGENSWQNGTQLPVGLSAYSLVAFEGKLYLFGGWDGSDYVNSVRKYDPSLDTWEMLTPMPTARGFAGAGVTGGQIHIVGGVSDIEVLDIHEVYIPEQDKDGADPWMVLAPLPEPRSYGRIVSVADIIHFIGGTNDSGNNLHSFKYFSQNDEWESFSIPMQESWTGLGAEIVGEHIYIFGGQEGSRLTDQNYSYRAVFSIMMPILP